MIGSHSQMHGHCKTNHSEGRKIHDQGSWWRCWVGRKQAGSETECGWGVAGLSFGVERQSGHQVSFWVFPETVNLWRKGCPKCGQAHNLGQME